MGHYTAVLRSKSLDEFAGPGALHMDLVFTVCDSAVNEACPVWPGHPTTAHWDVPDPKAATGTEAEIAVAFDEAYRMLRRRIELLLVAIPIGSIDRLALEESLREIGRSEIPPPCPRADSPVSGKKRHDPFTRSFGRIEIVLPGVQHRGQCAQASIELIHCRSRQRQPYGVRGMARRDGKGRRGVNAMSRRAAAATKVCERQWAGSVSHR